MRKSLKSEFATELKTLLEEPSPTNVPETSMKTAIVIDFMVYARKVPVKKMNLVCYEDLLGALWKTFSSLSKGSTRIDIVFDLYPQQSIKQGERNQRRKLEPIETNISTIKQQLPVEMDRFWSSSDSKVKFQQPFFKWMTSNGQSDVPVAKRVRKISPVYKYGLEKQYEYLPVKIIMKKPMIVYFVT